MDLTKLDYTLPQFARGVSPLSENDLLHFLDDDSAAQARELNRLIKNHDGRFITSLYHASAISSGDVQTYSHSKTNPLLEKAGVSIDASAGTIALGQSSSVTVKGVVTASLMLSSITHAVNTAFDLMLDDDASEYVIDAELYANAAQNYIVLMGRKYFSLAGDKTLNLHLNESAAGSYTIEGGNLFSVEILGAS